jgi:serine/threonine-protein kinase
MAATRGQENDKRSVPLARGREDSFEESPTAVSADPLLLEGCMEVPVEGSSAVRRSGLGAIEIVDHEDLAAAASVHGNETGLGDEEAAQRTVISNRPPISSVRLHLPYTPHELGQALVGKQLAHFQLEEFLGGGMGAVFRGRDLTLGRSVAVKVLPRGQDEDTIRRFKNEAQSAARLNHEHIARVFYIGEEDGWNFIIFEHIEGVTIRALVDQRGPLELSEAIRHTLQAAEALDHACQRDVVHRDIKPSNLIVSTDGSTKLVDMGLARLHQVESSRNDLTASGVTLGTFDYISPEQARDPRCADVRSDLYSLGCTLYFMLAGRPPFPEGTVLQKLLDHQSRQPPDLRVFRPDLPEEAVTVVNKLLAKQPDQRYQTPQELIAELWRISDALGLETGPRHRQFVEQPVLLAPRSSEQHMVWIAPTVLLILGVFMTEWWLRPTLPSKEAAFPAVVMPSSQAAPAPLQAQTPSAANLAVPSAEETAEASSSSSGLATTNSASGNESAPLTPSLPVADTASPRPPSQRAGSSVEAPSAAATAKARSDETPSVRAENGPTPRVAVANGSTRRAPALPPPQTVRMVIVGEKPKSPLPENAVWVETASEAIRQAGLNFWPDLEVIELRFTGVQQVNPVMLARRHLTVRAGQGHTPVLAFENGAGYSLDKHMLYLKQGDFTFEGVQMQWRLPPEDRAPRDWALLLLDDISGLTMRRCVLTIENIDSSGFPQSNGAAFFRMASSTLNQRAMLKTAALPAPEIVLTECVARGEADLLAASEVEPFELSWSQGLLATSERLADLGGAALGRSGLVQLRLDHVTAVAQEGLCRLASNENSPHQLNLHIEANHCLFSTDLSAPLVEHETFNQVASLRAQSEWGRLLRWSGANNARLEGEVVWRVDDTAETAPVEFHLSDDVWMNIVGGAGTFSRDVLAWRMDPASWAPHIHDRTVDAYAVDTSINPEEAVWETPGLSVALLPVVFREGLRN